MSRRNERWSAQDVALVKARRELKQTVKTPPPEAVTARTYTFTVPGLAQPGGSKQAFVPLDKKKTCTCNPHQTVYQPFRRPNGSIMANVVDANPKVGKWKKHIARIAHEEYAGPIFDSALRVTFIFYRPRPDGHYGAKGLSKEGRENPWPAVKPDVLKLARAAEDALTGLVWVDDAIIVDEHIRKEYGNPPRVEIIVEELVLPAEQDQQALFEFSGSQPPWEIKKK